MRDEVRKQKKWSQMMKSAPSIPKRNKILTVPNDDDITEGGELGEEWSNDEGILSSKDGLKVLDQGVLTNIQTTEQHNKYGTEQTQKTEDQSA